MDASTAPPDLHQGPTTYFRILFCDCPLMEKTPCRPVRVYMQGQMLEHNTPGLWLAEANVVIVIKTFFSLVHAFISKSELEK